MVKKFLSILVLAGLLGSFSFAQNVGPLGIPNGPNPPDNGGIVYVPDNVKTELDFMLYLLRTGQAAPQYPQPKAMPGYTAPAPVLIDVPNEALGIGPPHGF